MYMLDDDLLDDDKSWSATNYGQYIDFGQTTFCEQLIIRGIFLFLFHMLEITAIRLSVIFNCNM